LAGVIDEIEGDNDLEDFENFAFDTLHADSEAMRNMINSGKNKKENIDFYQI